jgi:mannosyl-oligosaccharide alpha-1,2-mannosidase
MHRLFQRWLALFALFTIALYSLLYYKDLPSPFRPSEPHHVDWAKIPQKHPPASLAPLPAGAPERLPDVQARSFPETEAQKAERLRRRDAVRDVFLRSWRAYRGAAWGHDELAPLSGSWKDHFGGWGATLVDSLDLLLLMELEDEFRDAVAACKSVDFSVTHVEVINVFETTIRFLGGLLSAHELAKGKDDGVLLQKARELSEMLYHSFDTVNRMPIARWAWQRYAIPFLCLCADWIGRIMGIPRMRTLTLWLRNLDPPVWSSPK